MLLPCCTVGSAFNELTFNLDTVATSTGIAKKRRRSQKIEQYGSAAQAAQLAMSFLHLESAVQAGRTQEIW